MKTLEELANEILYKLNFEKHKSTTQIVVEGLIEAQQQVKNLNIPTVSNNEVAVCRSCKHITEDIGNNNCRKCVNGSRFQKAN